MIPETSVNWKAFEYKFSDNPQRVFENLTYYLTRIQKPLLNFVFCTEFSNGFAVYTKKRRICRKMLHPT